MKTIGLIGGISWESTAHYYSLLNKLVNQRLGGYEAAKLLLYSINFAELQCLQFAEKWTEATELMLDAAQRLERGGADFLLIGANTMHISAPQIEKRIHLPLLHIADVTAERIVARGIRRVGLLGTAFTMEKDFLSGRLREKFGLEVIIPGADQRRVVHEIIFNELVHGIVRPESRERYRDIMAALVQAGAQGIILGCTELMMIIQSSDSTVPLFDTTAIHCEAAVEYALRP
jgi:aspartate racemase